MDKQKADELLIAIIGAYVWVANADEGVDLIEYHKFGQAIVESPFVTQFEEDQIRMYFKDTTTLFDTRYDEAVALTKSRLAKLRGQDHLCEEVIRMSRAAVVADAKIGSKEESALVEIAKAIAFDGKI